ncbi:riboflavin synthase subunit alpha [Neiella marina]|uniref:Riboflavin synthase n=1 Tax=Neiella marina TaxID=508461 RepID=A0A8J2XNF0_9GAMM|nr:riboflavin synthase [Neiella marina]GGA71509.1 riboflavin synthase subunit alpha [Neiella marina]
MFTGIIESVGHVKGLVKSGPDMALTIAVGKLDMSDVQLGDSIAVNGVCLTVTKYDAASFSADVSVESLSRTALAGLQIGWAVNLEKAVTPSTRLGGHLVSGHVDGTARLLSAEQQGSAWQYWFEAPAELAKYIAEKGSVTIDGISLTINEVDGAKFRLTIIPHTRAETTLIERNNGDLVNLEVDLIARYLERLMTASSEASPTDGVTLDLLAKSGFMK